MSKVTAMCDKCDATLSGASVDEMLCWNDSHETFCTKPEGKQQAGFTAAIKEDKP